MQQQRREWHSPLRWKQISTLSGRGNLVRKYSPFWGTLAKGVKRIRGSWVFELRSTQVFQGIHLNQSFTVGYSGSPHIITLPETNKKSPPQKKKVVPPHPTKKTNITVIIYYVDLYTPPPHPVPVPQSLLQASNDPSIKCVVPQSSWWWRASIQSARAPHLHPLRHRLHRLWCLHGFWHRGILVEKKHQDAPGFLKRENHFNQSWNHGKCEQLQTY